MQLQLFTAVRGGHSIGVNVGGKLESLFENVTRAERAEIAAHPRAADRDDVVRHFDVEIVHGKARDAEMDDVLVFQLLEQRIGWESWRAARNGQGSHSAPPFSLCRSSPSREARASVRVPIPLT